MSLRSEIITSHAHTKRRIAAAIVGASCSLAGAGIALLARWDVDAPAPVPAPEPITEEVLVPVPMPMVAPVEAPLIAHDRTCCGAHTDEVQLVFRAGGATYMQLDKLGDAKLPNHGAFKLFDRGEKDEWRTSAIATVKNDDLPAAYSRWIGASVMVDGTCKANVTGFAVVARLTGDVGYAVEDSSKGWDVKSVLENGAPMLAAKLDGCANGTFARDAALPPIEIPAVIHDAPLEKQAKDKLLGSSPASKAQIRWEEAQREGEWAKSDSTTIETIVVRHPTTNVTWVSIHAYVSDGCGGPDINVWGLYRVVDGKLVTEQQRDLGELYSVKTLVDLDGDGELEVIGAPWIGLDTIVARASGDEVARLALPFYGCPC